MSFSEATIVLVKLCSTGIKSGVKRNLQESNRLLLLRSLNQQKCRFLIQENELDQNWGSQGPFFVLILGLVPLTFFVPRDQVGNFVMFRT